jgi:broad specificity phosphatase PhoE
MLNVYILRHGQTQWNADGNRYCGRTDIPLTDLGKQQAQTVAGQLKEIPFEGVYSSPLQRAFHTAQVAGNGLPVTVDQRLIEADFGEWEGKTKEQFIPENKALWDNWCNDPLSTKAGGTGESALEVIKRVDRFFTDILHKHPSGNILVAAHNGVNRLYLAYKLGMQVKDYRRLFIDNCSITMFQLHQDRDFVLVHLNTKR